MPVLGTVSTFDGSQRKVDDQLLPCVKHASKTGRLILSLQDRRLVSWPLFTRVPNKLMGYGLFDFSVARNGKWSARTGIFVESMFMTFPDKDCSAFQDSLYNIYPFHR